MTLTQAQALAHDITGALAPLCHRLEIAGSVRRQKPDDIKDLEVCLVPNILHASRIADLINRTWGEPELGRWPAKYTKIRFPKQIDFFTCTPATWGLIYFIRTGPAGYVKRALAHWKELSDGGYSEEGILHTSDAMPVATREEADVFQALNWPWTEPKDRQ